ncbi:hypothetical protein BLNAU_5216 [Blattamonas nauphoetae]|uniref:Uncharacterized protein n=1 Tax=Blattamonas nauphoetae TaxID=2049346 RepID=A0ABQ9Y7I3_9EUKA|nr:hypothetical protein BLNAU_5216 [Blattamonas nauphoetae]
MRRRGIIKGRRLQSLGRYQQFDTVLVDIPVKSKEHEERQQNHSESRRSVKRRRPRKAWWVCDMRERMTANQSVHLHTPTRRWSVDGRAIAGDVNVLCFHQRRVMTCQSQMIRDKTLGTR